jgi:DNA topoisomerase IA
MRVLNVAEKPSVAKEISNILSSGSSQRVCLCVYLLLLLFAR